MVTVAISPPFLFPHVFECPYKFDNLYKDVLYNNYITVSLIKDFKIINEGCIKDTLQLL